MTDALDRRANRMDTGAREKAIRITNSPLNGSLWKLRHEPKDMNHSGIRMREPSNEKPIGEWNNYQTICVGSSVEIRVNGKSMNKATGCNISSGFIGRQSEGMEIEIRRVFGEPANN